MALTSSGSGVQLWLRKKHWLKSIDLDVATLSEIELGYDVLPIRAYLSLTAALRISFQDLVVELGRNDPYGTELRQMVSGIATSTTYMREIIRLRDAIEAERETASRQFEFLAKRNGMHDIFTREAAEDGAIRHCVGARPPVKAADKADLISRMNKLARTY